MEATRTIKKVLTPCTNKSGKTYWVKLGRAFENRDGSTTVYLDAFPTNSKLHIRDLDERDLQPKPQEPQPAAEGSLPF